MIPRLVAVLVLLVSAGCAAPPPEPDGSSAHGERSTAASRPSAASRPGAASEGLQGTADRRVARARHVFPVRGRTSYSRFHHDYPATDIFAACRTRVVAPTSGVVLEVSRRDRWRPARDNPALRGGKFVSLRGVDRVRYYGSHLRSVASGVRAGRRVSAGALLGRVGQSGNARGTGCHLHFGISPLCARTGDWWVRRGTVRPFRFLRAWERHRNLSPARAVRRWRAENGCPSRPR